MVDGVSRSMAQSRPVALHNDHGRDLYRVILWAVLPGGRRGQGNLHRISPSVVRDNGGYKNRRKSESCGDETRLSETPRHIAACHALLLAASMNSDPQNLFGRASAIPTISTKTKTHPYGWAFVLVEMAGVEPVCPKRAASLLLDAALFSALS